MRSNSTNSRWLINISSDSGQELVVEQPDPDPIDLRFKVGRYIMIPLTAFVNEDAARLVAAGEPALIEDSFIDVAGTDIVRDILSTITEHTELRDFSFSSFFESSGSNEEDLLQNVNFANVHRNTYGRPILAVPATGAEGLIKK